MASDVGVLPRRQVEDARADREPVGREAVHDLAPHGRIERHVLVREADARGHRVMAARSSAEMPSARNVSASSSSAPSGDRKSTRLNSSHLVISYAVFCLKKKKNTKSN